MKLTDKRFIKIFLIGFWSIIINFNNYFSNAQNVVFGYASSYKNDTLELFHYEDIFTSKKIILSKSAVDKNGFF